MEQNSTFIGSLLKEFPSIYHSNPEITTPSGWDEIVYELSEKIRTYCDNMKVVIHVSQVKEKFGGLRFYYRPHDKNIDKFIAESAKKTFETCQICGEHDSLSNNYGGLSVLCATHKEKMRNHKENNDAM